MPKEYAIVDLSTVPPIVFTMGGQMFHIPRKQRPEVGIYMESAVFHDADGERVYPDSVVRRAAIDLLADELFNAETGEWEPCDDKQRFVNMLNSQRVEVPAKVLGELIFDVAEVLIGDPTGGSSESSAGPESTSDGSTDSAGSATDAG
jgi:hypothetical protein